MDEDEEFDWNEIEVEVVEVFLGPDAEETECCEACVEGGSPVEELHDLQEVEINRKKCNQMLVDYHLSVTVYLNKW